MKKKWIVAFIAAGVLLLGGVTVYAVKTSSQSTVKVVSVSDMSGGGGWSDNSLSGNITSDVSQNIYLADSQTVKKIHVKEGDTVCIIGGGGKSGVLCCYQAMKNVGPYGKVIVVEYSEENARRIKEMNLATHVIVADATKVMDVYKKVTAIAGERGCEVTINNVNVPSTEMTSILVTKGQGCVYFFSMATSFTKAALGAEGVGKDINLIVGNGYAKGHAELTLSIIRESEEIRELFNRLYVK